MTFDTQLVVIVVEPGMGPFLLFIELPPKFT